ncbi:MAG: XisI protein [Caldilinea sp. CFX5]|nr:XisI protein [Caldilinea sp. CFX5]
MDRIKQYRQVIESVLKEYASLFNQQPVGVDVVAVCDENTDTYAIVNVGWDGKERMNATTVLMRIVNGKIWVEEDRTMYGFVDELLAKGIKADEIVLAFQPPKMRQYTQFAVA